MSFSFDKNIVAGHIWNSDMYTILVLDLLPLDQQDLSDFDNSDDFDVDMVKLLK